MSESVSRQAMDKARRQGSILVSLPVLAELDEVLSRPKFDRYVSLEDREVFLGKFVRETEAIEITESIQVCRDSRDDMFLELAISGGADFVITGDRDLLALDPFRGVRILTPDAFLRCP
jgi:putative PIN family toxin of toxin-antitoxin system